ncbi:DNRLRE domain-containing protein [Brevibacillus agri]|uniref:DNRLRE domain-containing protein n=1 Tax=Brevibacillus agri TaxID=51101 RepID=UPI002867F78F|nr:DNRLRE domain-containing protein [Brevibacillus agri]
MPVVTLNYTNTYIMDGHVYENTPTSSYGTGPTFSVGKDVNGFRYYGLLYFDFGLIPNDAIINSATLGLYKSSGDALTIDIHAVTSSWNEGISWNTKPSFEASPSASFSVSAANQAYTADVKNLVQRIVNGENIKGFLLRQEASFVGCAFMTRENGATGGRPTLTIDYTIPSTGKKQVEFVGANSSQVGSGTTLNLPMPTGVAIGDLLIAMVYTSSTSVITEPSGWTLIANDVASSSYYFSVLYKFADGTEGASQTFTRTGASGISGISLAYRNVKKLDTYATKIQTTTSLPSLANATLSAQKTLAVIIHSLTGGGSYTPPLSFSEVLDTVKGMAWFAGHKYMYEKTSVQSSDTSTNYSTKGDGFSTLIALEPVTNNIPTLTLTSPSDNQTLAEGSTFPIAGEASDADNGNVVTVKYKINNGTARAIASGVSDGSSPLSFAKTLTYSNKRLWDGAVDVTGADLAENVDHVLTVWAEDDKGGKSAEVTRKFRVIWNRPPTISGENSNLGIMEAPPSVEYSITEPETNPFTVTEKINGQIIRTFAGVAGRQETITIPHELWLRLEPGVQHALTIEASDDQGMTSTRTYTLTRFVDKIVFSLDFATMQQETKDFFTTDVAAKRLLLTPIWELPPGAILLVEVCNNAYDTEPTWEDATIVVKLNRAHLFANETKTADKWGINFRFQIEKGTATQPIYLKGVGGAFD